MAGNVAAVLGAGARFGFDATGSGTYTYVEGLEVYPATNNAAESKEKTTVADTRMVYGTGLKDSADIEITGIYLKDDADQAAFLAACEALTEMEVVIELPNVGTSGEKRTFTFQPLGVNDSETTADEWVKFVVPGKQQSDVLREDLTP